jgi:tellurite resistance-related uncharacterized protein
VSNARPPLAEPKLVHDVHAQLAELAHHVEASERPAEPKLAHRVEASERLAEPKLAHRVEASEGWTMR